jgi:membrane protease YdiL (CAAX protease family)
VQLPLLRPLLLGMLALGGCGLAADRAPAHDEAWRVAAFWAGFTVPLVDWLLVARRRRHTVRDVMGAHRIVGELGAVLLTTLAVLGVRMGWLAARLWLDPEWGEGAPTGLDIESPMLQLPLLIVVVVVGPIAEEILFRGILFRRLLRRWPPLLAAFGSSLLFGAAHFDLVGSTFMGLALVALYVMTRSLWVPVAAHALNNLLAMLSQAALFERILDAGWLVLALPFLAIPWLFVLFRRGVRQLSSFPRG